MVGFVKDVLLQDPKTLEDLTGLTQLHAETHARGMHHQVDDVSSGKGAEVITRALPGSDEDNASIPDIDDDWTSL